MSGPATRCTYCPCVERLVRFVGRARRRRLSLSRAAWKSAVCASGTCKAMCASVYVYGATKRNQGPSRELVKSMRPVRMWHVGGGR
eukprot:scaffold1228_cov115-Isochrysis_galbana.AAC.10